VGGRCRLQRLRSISGDKKGEVPRLPSCTLDIVLCCGSL